MPPSTIRRPGVAFIHFTRVCYPRTSAIPMHPLGLAASGAPFGERARRKWGRETGREKGGERKRLWRSTSSVSSERFLSRERERYVRIYTL